MQKINQDKSIPRTFVLLEIVAGALAIVFLIYTLRPLLLFKTATLTHDHLYWGYPVFQFFAENLLNGLLPLWNPFTHGGEPFYPLIVHSKLLEPITLITIFLGHIFTDDLVKLYNWAHINQNMVMVSGIYLLLRLVAENIFIRISLIPILLYASFIFSSFRQPAPLYHFLWAPFVIFFLLRIIFYKDDRWHNWLFLAGVIGISCQSYFFAGLWVFLLFFFLGLLVFHQDLLKNLFKSPKIVPKLTVTAFIILIMMLPNAVIALETDKFVYPLRMTASGYETGRPHGAPQQVEGDALPHNKGIFMPYRLIANTGSFSSIWDFIQLIYPEGNWAVSHKGRWRWGDIWGNSSEIHMYIGLLPWAIVLVGFIAGQHELKKVGILLVIGFGFLVLGPPGGLHRILYYVYPPLWFVRHTHGFILFFLVALLYFYVLGFNFISSKWRHALGLNMGEGILIPLKNSPLSVNNLRSIIAFILFSGSIIGLVFHLARLKYPATDYAFLYIIMLVFIGWILNKYLGLGKKGLFAGLLVGHISLVLIFIVLFEKNLTEFVVKILFVLGIPMGLFVIIKIYNRLFRDIYVVSLLLFVFSACLIWDLQDHLGLIKDKLYLRQKHPANYLPIKTNAHKPIFNQSRKGFLFPQIGTTGQSIRYLSLLYRQPHVFSPTMKVHKVFLDSNAKIIDEFKAGLYGMRWNSFLLLQKYFELIHSRIPPGAIKDMFSVGKPMFQFKKGFFHITENYFSSFVKKWGPERAFRLLDEYIFVNTKKIDNYMAPFIISEAEYEAIIENDPLGKRPDQRHKVFTYSIKKYDYDSVGIEVSADRKGIFYWADGYDKNWHAYVNGIEVPIYRANVNFKAIVLPKGVSHVSFVYQHIRFKTALIVFYATFVLSGTSAVIIWLFGKEIQIEPEKQSVITC